MMKKTILWALAAMLALPATAQTYGRPHTSRYDRYPYAPTHTYAARRLDNYFGLRLGANIASISSGDVDLDTNARAGLYVGAVFGTQLAYYSPVWLEIGVGYSEKGGTTNGTTDEVKYRLGYLQTPITVKYSIGVGNVRIQPFLGGYLAVGVAGKAKDYATRQQKEVFDVFKRFDGGLRLGCGLEYQMLYAEVGFDFGLANINKDNFDTAHNRALLLTAGVNF